MAGALVLVVAVVVAVPALVLVTGALVCAVLGEALTGPPPPSDE